MDVFVSDVPLLDYKSFPFGYVLEHSFQLLFNKRWFQHFSTVFGTPDNVIIADPC